MSERDVLFPVLCGFGPKRTFTFFREAARQIVTELSSPLRFFSTSSKGGIFTKAVYQKVFDFWRKIITKA